MLPPARLLKPKEEVARILQSQIDIGRELLETQINSQTDLEQAGAANDRWDGRKKEYLNHLFDNSSKREAYEGPAVALPAASASTWQPNLQEDVTRFRGWGKELVSRLEIILSCVDIMDEGPGVRPAIEARPASEVPSGTGEGSMDLLAQLRRGLTSDQREMLNAIWAYYAKNGHWISRKRLHSQFQGRLRVIEVRAALEDVGGSVVFETIDDCYALKFLGVLLTDAGPGWEEMCVCYLDHARMKFQENPDVKVLIGCEVQAGLDLSPDESRLLGQIIALGPLSGGSFSGAGTPDWSAGVPRDVDTLPEWQDLGLYLRREALTGYEKNAPITQHGLMRYWANRIGPLPSDLADPVRSVHVEPEAELPLPATPRVDKAETVPDISDQTPQAAAFLSYAHVDDKHDQKQLTRLRERLAGEVGMYTGQPFEIFQDRTAIRWGQQWGQRIEQALGDEVTFLIPILTPSFFTSEPCREELRLFLERERRLARNDLILPIYYVDCLVLNSESERQRDELAQEINKRQYADWRGLRFKSLTTQAVREKLAELAVQIRDVLGSVGGPGAS